jgi:hypothetical protein
MARLGLPTVSRCERQHKGHQVHRARLKHASKVGVPGSGSRHRVAA